MEIIKIIVQALTPLLIALFGFIFLKKIEKKKLNVLKEKEWQVKWADLFFKQAIAFNDNISLTIFCLYLLQFEKNKDKVDILNRKISDCFDRISEADWNIRNYAQFSENYGQQVIIKQQQLMDSLKILITNKQGNLEVIRKMQFEYNESVRKAHGDILNVK